jgi:porin
LPSGESDYQIHLFRGVTFAPDFQYYIRPNAQSNVPDAALIGFKTHIELF